MRSSSTPASTAPEPARAAKPAPILETCARMVREQLPNFFRLYLNPYVVQTCLCLSRHVEEGWPAAGEFPWQSFLANSFEEALSGAIKLVRHECNRASRPAAGLLIDPDGRLGDFASVSVAGGGLIEFIPDITVIRCDEAEPEAIEKPLGFVVLASLDAERAAAALLRRLRRQPRPLLIACVDRQALAGRRGAGAKSTCDWPPDVVVFDESFVNHEAPFAAFTAPGSRFAAWNRIKQGAFHSTTYQPNTISTLHFLRCLEESDPRLFATLAPELERIRRDPDRCAQLLGQLYSPFLARTIRALGFARPDLRAAGHFVMVGNSRIFDGVAGIAASIRGHNPDSYVAEIESIRESETVEESLAERLQALTGLEHFVPTVSGASAVETALRIALAAQFPRRHVLAFQGGFGGKTLLALTGTANPSYKTHLDPLYGQVTYIDPYSATVIQHMEAVLRAYPAAVVQLELIQAVGGVRAIPPAVLRYLQENQRRWGYLLFVDEVQTGMYRTGPFVRSAEVGISPDILALGKGSSDMMFPFGLTLYSSAVAERLAGAQPELPQAIRRRYGHALGYQTVLNVLQQADDADLARHVRDVGAQFARLLNERLAACKAVREVRAHGLLIGIELDTTAWPRSWLKKQLYSLYLLAMLRHATFPLLVGYCQYEPNVLKLTPPLSITPAEVRQVCDTIGDVLHRPLYRLLAAGLGSLAASFPRRLWPRWRLFA